MHRIAALFALSLSSSAFAAWPMTLNGTACSTALGLCGDLSFLLRANHTGQMTVTVTMLGLSTTTPIQWQVDPASGRVGFLFAPRQGLIGSIAGSCASGTQTIPSPAPLVPLVGPTMEVEWEACATP